MLRHPENFQGGVRSRDGGDFLVGEDRWRRNPRHVVPKPFLHVVRLWNRCRSGMGGFAALPEPGGINQQPAWLMAAFGVLDSANAAMNDAERAERT